MTRAAAFAFLLLFFVALTFPHELVVRRVLASRLPPAVSVSFETVRPSLRPLGYRLQGVVVVDPPYRATIEILRAGVGLFGGVLLHAELCNGIVSATLARVSSTDGRPARNATVRFDGIDPSLCLELGGPMLSGGFSGTVDLEAIGRGSGAPPFGRIARTGRFSLAGGGGILSGYLPASRHPRPSGKPTEPQPIGQWEFAHIALEGEIRGDRIIVTHGKAEAEGLAWETKSAAFISTTATPRVQAEIRARRLDESGRSKAILGLLPKTPEKGGWRYYRVSGGVSSVQIAGVR